MDRAGTGRRGEAAAARFYEKQGAALITHNYHTRMGEIDLILREPDGTLVFCEVKTRAKDSLDTPAAAVNAAKQRRIIASAAWYLQAPIRATSRCVSTWPKSSLLTAGAGWYIL